jgi:hypothetical protein
MEVCSRRLTDWYHNTHPQAMFNIAGGGPDKGFSALMDGRVEIAQSSRQVLGGFNYHCIGWHANRGHFSHPGRGMRLWGSLFSILPHQSFQLRTPVQLAHHHRILAPVFRYFHK